MESLRTFIAVKVPPEVHSRASDLIARLQSTAAKVNWVSGEQLHLTVSFLGDVQAQRIPDVCQAVTEAVAEISPFEIVCAGAGAFPNSQRPRTVWLGLEEGTEQMTVVHQAVERRLADLGFRTDGRRYHPHLTLGRVRGSGADDLGRLIIKNEDFQAGQAEVKELVIFASELTRQGPVYTVLGRAKLTG